MKKRNYDELLHLYVLGELPEEEKILVENRMMESSVYREEYESLKQLQDALIKNRPEPAGDLQLTDARSKLLNSLKSEVHQSSIITKTAKWFADLFTGNYKFALSGAAAMLVGLFIGYLVFSSPSGIPGRMVNQIDLDALNRNEMQISNIRFDNSLSENGDVEIFFDAVKPVSYKGNANDPVIQRLLAEALVKASNPGTRLRSLNTLIKQSKKSEFKPDIKVRDALISAMKVDENPAVRREALRALLKYPVDDKIRDGFLFVLSHDTNSGLRVAAINGLLDLNIQGKSLDKKILEELNKKAETDDNDYIRLRAASLLREVD